MITMAKRWAFLGGLGLVILVALGSASVWITSQRHDRDRYRTTVINCRPTGRTVDTIVAVKNLSSRPHTYTVQVGFYANNNVRVGTGAFQSVNVLPNELDTQSVTVDTTLAAHRCAVIAVWVEPRRFLNLDIG